MLFDNASSSPQQTSLVGIGTPIPATLSTTTLNFGNQVVGTPSLPMVVTLTDESNAPLTNIAFLPPAINFSETNDCGSTLAVDHGDERDHTECDADLHAECGRGLHHAVIAFTVGDARLPQFHRG